MGGGGLSVTVIFIFENYFPISQLLINLTSKYYNISILSKCLICGFFTEPKWPNRRISLVTRSI